MRRQAIACAPLAGQGDRRLTLTAAEVEDPLALHVAEQSELPLARHLGAVDQRCRIRAPDSGPEARRSQAVVFVTQGYCRNDGRARPCCTGARRRGLPPGSPLRTRGGTGIGGGPSPRGVRTRDTSRREPRDRLRPRPQAYGARLPGRRATTRVDVCDAHPELLRGGAQPRRAFRRGLPRLHGPRAPPGAVRLRRHAQGRERPLCQPARRS